MTNVISRTGFTWTLDKYYEYGTYITGDPWVKGPINIIDIDPAPTLDSGNYSNGTMVNPDPQATSQGYCNTLHALAPYSHALNVGYGVSSSTPLSVSTGSSVISSQTAGTEVEKVAILTVVSTSAATNAWRPQYCTGAKITYTEPASWGLTLPSVTSVGTRPDLVGVFSKPWIDHMQMPYMSDHIHPTDWMPSYSRDMCVRTGAAALMMCCDIPQDEKDHYITHIIQIGIDWYGQTCAGGYWKGEGGHGNGRKFPILFAGLMLDNAAMVTAAQGTAFGEDDQTFYVAQSDIDAGRYTSAYLGVAEWGNNHRTNPEDDNQDWYASTTPELYRRAGTANVWHSQILACHMMGIKAEWDHNALFDYQDRYMHIESPGDWHRSWWTWDALMWDEYRADYGTVNTNFPEYAP
jgi:hypothetical protein